MEIILWGRKMDSTLKGRIQKILPPAVTLREKDEVEDLQSVTAVILHGGSFGREEMDMMPALKLIQLTWSENPGVDLDAAAARGITVTGAHFAHSTAVAEHTMLLILALARRLLLLDTAARDPKRFPRRWSGLAGLGFSFAYNWPEIGDLQHLKGKTLGLLGLGGIGSEVARMAGAFGLKILYWKKNPLPRSTGEILNANSCSFKQIFRRSDFVSVHLSLNKETTNLIGAEEFALMKPTAYFINTARGLIVDEVALCCALREGKIAGAALDVFCTEPLPEDSPLLKTPNLILTPHCASGFDSFDNSQEHIAHKITENIALLVAGKKPVDVLNGIYP